MQTKNIFNKQKMATGSGRSKTEHKINMMFDKANGKFCRVINDYIYVD